MLEELIKAIHDIKWVNGAVDSPVVGISQPPKEDHDFSYLQVRFHRNPPRYIRHLQVGQIVFAAVLNEIVQERVEPCYISVTAKGEPYYLKRRRSAVIGPPWVFCDSCHRSWAEGVLEGLKTAIPVQQYLRFLQRAGPRLLRIVLAVAQVLHRIAQLSVYRLHCFLYVCG